MVFEEPEARSDVSGVQRDGAERGGHAAFLLLVGLLFPTSLGGTISNGLYALHQAVFIVVATWLVVRHGALGSPLQVWNAVFVAVWCVAATVFAPFQELALGAFGVYALITMLLVLDLSRLEAPSSRAVLRVATVVLLLAAVGVVAGSALVVEVLTGNYALAYPELLPMMMTLRKPVFTFASHSLAGYFYFVLFYLNFESFRAGRRGVDLALAVGCVLGGAMLTSMTAAVLMPLALVLLFLGSGKARWPLFGALALGAGTAAWMFRSQLADLAAVTNLLATFESSGSGLSGRFGQGGNLLNNLELIRTMPLRPIGLSFSSTVFYGDSGPVEYLLRGSWPLLIGVYGGLALFLWRNLLERRHAVLLFLVTVAFEVGMTVMTYHRFVFLLPFAVMHLNQLTRSSWTGTAPDAWSPEGVEGGAR